MPLAGTKREQKHYREIREKYPEKGKEYAARVARNIVRANTSEGRKLKGTTEYGRTWGPPYSEPLSKKGVDTNVLHSPSEEFVQSEPMNAPQTPAAALREQKKLRQAGIDRTKAAYACGAHEAYATLGLIKNAGRLNPLREWFARLLAGPYGEVAVRTPVQSAMGALGGAAAGQLYSEHPGRGAMLGAMTGGLGGLAVAGAPRLRSLLLRSLRGMR